MRSKIFVKGKNSQEKFNSVEQTLQRFSRRLHKSIGVVVPPLPISTFCDSPEEDGTLMRYMFPAKGYIETAAIYIENFPDVKKVDLVADISDKDMGSQKEFQVKNIVNIFSIGMQVEPGSRFELKLVDPSISISGIWMAFLYNLKFGGSKLQTMLVEKLEENMDA